MKLTLEERFRKRMLRFGKKNKVCFVCAIPALTLGVSLFHGIAYCRGNGKRFAMLSMTFLLFVVYSSFSFPIFIAGDGSDNGLNGVSAEAQGIELATEADIDVSNVVLLEDEDVILEGEHYTETSHGMDIVARYSASDILESAQGNGTQGGAFWGGDVRENSSPDGDRQGNASLDGEISDSEPRESGSAENEEGDGRSGQEDDGTKDAPEFSRDDWRLVLINKQHSIPDDYELILGSISTMKGSMKCDKRIIEELLIMLQAAKEDGIALAICSPYRDMEYQKMLFNRKITRYMNMGMSYMEAYQLSSQVVTVPGASEHQIGLALDIVCDTYTALDEGFGETDAGIWLAENSYKYGFILRYPKGKEYITGIDYEPWHFRYVGVEAATVITEEEITLEEFWEEYL